MPSHPEYSIHYQEPDIISLRKSGFQVVDMHLHTCHSDGRTRVPDLITYAKARQIGVAITDHNEISGVLKAVACHEDTLIIPGIELETLEGPHLLFYFYTPGELEDFFDEFNYERKRETQGQKRNLPVAQCLQIAESYDCLRVSAHPFGYFGINRGVLKCVEKQMLPGVLSHLDGIEVICGGMMKNLNLKAIAYAAKHHIPYTGGSDAHILRNVGDVVTCVQADTPEEFLKGILRKENCVVGKPGSYISKGITAGVIAWSFVPYTASGLHTRYQQHKNQANDLVTAMKERIQKIQCYKKETGISEERGEEPRN